MSDLSVQLGMLISAAHVSDMSAPPLLPSLSLFPVDDIAWNAEQLVAIDQIAKWRHDPTAPRLLALTGAAGAGKTTVLRALAPRLGAATAWAAMTGKAASRTREAAGVKARTLHSALYHPPREEDNQRERKIDLVFDDVRDSALSLLVLDEASMVSPKIRADLDRSRYDKILLVGDPYQIPPVLSKREEADHGADYSVFREVKGPHLSQVMRTQGATLAAATTVRERLVVPTDRAEFGSSLYEYTAASSGDAALHLAVDRWFEDQRDHVLVTWRNESRMAANLIIRKRLGIFDLVPQPGEVVVVRKNVYRAGLMNGDEVKVVEWEGDGPTLCGIPTRYLRVTDDAGRFLRLLVPVASFDGTMPYVGLDALRQALRDADCEEPTPITYGYCRTGHTVQGSEFRRVTTFLPGDLRSHHFVKSTTLPDGSVMPFSLRFLYVAISRAKKHATLIVS